MTQEIQHLLTDLTTFVQDHQAHGKLTGGEPWPSGYRVTVPCPYGVVFERWVSELDAAADLLRLAGRKRDRRWACNARASISN